MSGAGVIMRDGMGREVLEVGQSGYWDGQGDFPRACREEPELEVGMLGSFPRLLGLRQKGFGPVWHEFSGK